MKNANIVKYVSIALAVLMLALLVMQFLPFWSTEEESVSINGYLWMPNEHKALTKIFKAELDDKKFDPVRIVLWPVLTLVLGVAGIVVSILKREEILPSVLAICCGLTGMLTYLTSPLFKLGSGWMLHLVVAVVVLAAGIAGLVIYLLANKKAK